MFERRHQPLASRALFAARMARFVAAAVALDGLFVLIGAVGYHCLEGLGWLDATLNAALVITGNGPLYEIHSPGAKVFMIFHALLGCIAYVVVAAVLLAPLFHRLMHAFHLEVDRE